MSVWQNPTARPEQSYLLLYFYYFTVSCIYCCCDTTNFPLGGLIKFILFYSIHPHRDSARFWYVALAVGVACQFLRVTVAAVVAGHLFLVSLTSCRKTSSRAARDECATALLTLLKRAGANGVTQSASAASPLCSPSSWCPPRRNSTCSKPQLPGGCASSLAESRTHPQHTPLQTLAEVPGSGSSQI